MTNFRRITLVALASVLSLTAACSDSSFSTAPAMGGARLSGYTVIADRAKPPVDTASVLANAPKTGTTTTTTSTSTTSK